MKDSEIFNHVRGQLNKWIYKKFKVEYKSSSADDLNIIENRLLRFLRQIYKQNNYLTLINNLCESTTFSNIKFNKLLIVFLFHITENEFNYNDIKQIVTPLLPRELDEKEFDLIKHYMLKIDFMDINLCHAFLMNNISSPYFSYKEKQTLKETALLKLNDKEFTKKEAIALINYYADSQHSDFYYSFVIHSLVKWNKNDALKEVLSKIELSLLEQFIITSPFSLYKSIELTIENNNFEMFKLLYDKVFNSHNNSLINISYNTMANTLLPFYGNFLIKSIEHLKLRFAKLLISRPLFGASYEFDKNNNQIILKVSQLTFHFPLNQKVCMDYSNSTKIKHTLKLLPDGYYTQPSSLCIEFPKEISNLFDLALKCINPPFPEKKQTHFTPIAFPFKDVSDVENAMDLKKESSFISGAVLPIFSKLSQKKSVHSR